MRAKVRRYRPYRDVLVLRTLTAVAGCVVAATILAVRPSSAVAVLAGLTAIVSLLTTAGPQWPGPTITLGLLAATYAVATQSTGMGARIPASVAMAATLWTLHFLYSLAAEIPWRATISGDALRHWRRRLVAIFSIALPLVAVTGLAGTWSSDWLWLRTLGLLAALAIAGVPAVLAVRRADDATTQPGSRRQRFTRSG